MFFSHLFFKIPVDKSVEKMDGGPLENSKVILVVVTFFQ